MRNGLIKSAEKGFRIVFSLHKEKKRLKYAFQRFEVHRKRKRDVCHNCRYDCDIWGRHLIQFFSACLSPVCNDIVDIIESERLKAKSGSLGRENCLMYANVHCEKINARKVEGILLYEDMSAFVTIQVHIFGYNC